MRGRFTMVETAVAASLGGVLLAIFVPTFVRELRTDKISEAADQLEALAKGVRSYYVRPRAHCLPPPAGPTPAEPSTERRAVRFSEEPGGSVWRALRFEPEEPIRYRYSYVPAASGCDLAVGTLVTLRAEGDLDGDGRRSTFERTLRVDEHRALGNVGILEIRDRVE